jgi:hypothetical protein
MKPKLILILIALVCNAVAFSQIIHPRNKAQVDFHPTITHDFSGGFMYSYQVTSRESSEEVFDTFRLLIVDSMLTNNITKIASPSNKKWYIDGSKRGFISGSAANRFIEIPPSDGLAPGEYMTVSFASTGLPAITTCYAQSFSLPLSESEDDSLHALGYTDAQISPKWMNNSFRNQTVAPNTGLLNLLPLTFLDTLTSYTIQSLAFGWIKNQVTANNYLGYFSSVKAQLQSNNIPAARSTLQTVLTNAISDSKSNLTSEAYALIYYNTEYLITKFPPSTK